MHTKHHSTSQCACLYGWKEAGCVGCGELCGSLKHSALLVPHVFEGAEIASNDGFLVLSSVGCAAVC